MPDRRAAENDRFRFSQRYDIEVRFTGTEPVGFYTYGAFGYELTTAVLAAIALRRSAAPA